MDLADTAMAFIGILALYATITTTNKFLWNKLHPTKEEFHDKTHANG